jgi:hypothetical protein
VKFLKRLFGQNKSPERDEDRFARLVISALHDRDLEIRVEYDPEKFELMHVDPLAQGQRMFLHNSFAEFRRLPEDERTTHLNRVIDFIVESRRERPKGDAALDMLLPVVRARADILGFIAGEAPGLDYNHSSQPFCDNMLLMLALDSETSIALLNDEGLGELDISFEDALGIAVAHLDERGEHRFMQLEEGIFVSACDDHYDASRVLLPGLFEQLPLNGNPVAIVQSRSSVLVTGSNDLNGLEKIAQIALDDFPEQERAVSLVAIELKNAEWSQFEILPHHPQSLKNLSPNQQRWACGATAEALQKQLGEDIFVANPILVQPEGVTSTSTIVAWAAGVATACPLVDAIGLQEDRDFPQIIRRLEDVLEICGPFAEIEQIPYPRRWLLPSNLSDDQRRYLTDNYPEYEFQK